MFLLQTLQVALRTYKNIAFITHIKIHVIRALLNSNFVFAYRHSVFIIHIKIHVIQAPVRLLVLKL